MWKRLKNVYRQFPLCFFVEKEAEEAWKEADQETLNEIMEKNGEYLREKKGEEAALEAEVLSEAEPPQPASMAADIASAIERASAFFIFVFLLFV